MSISSEQDPVDAVRLILDDDTNTWANHGSEPDYIERLEETEPSVKENRAENGKTAVYVWSPDVGTISPFGADAPDYDATEVVQANVMAGSSSETSGILSDVISLVFDYYGDNEQNSQWVSMQPSDPSDETGGGFYTGAHSESSVQVVLRGVRDT